MSGSPDRFSRRTLLKVGGVFGLVLASGNGLALLESACSEDQKFIPEVEVLTNGGGRLISDADDLFTKHINVKRILFYTTKDQKAQIFIEVPQGGARSLYTNQNGERIRTPNFSGFVPYNPEFDVNKALDELKNHEGTQEVIIPEAEANNAILTAANTLKTDDEQVNGLILTYPLPPTNTDLMLVLPGGVIHFNEREEQEYSSPAILKAKVRFIQLS